MRLLNDDYVCGRDAGSTSSGVTRMAIRLRGRRTTGASTCLLHFTLQPADFEAAPLTASMP